MTETHRNLAFFGSDAIAIPCLHALMENDQDWKVAAVLTQPDRPSGRGRNLQPNPVKSWALEHGIPVRDPEKPTHHEVQWLKELKIDLTMVMAYGHILKEEFLNYAPLGCFNLHASLLPKYRGASPVETAIAMGEVQTGVTLMQVIPQMDAGPMIDCEPVDIGEGDTGQQVRQKIAQACIPLLGRSVPNLLSGKYPLLEQDENQATYCRKLSKADGQLNFRLSADELVSRSRAFASWPGCYFVHQDKVLRVGKMNKFPHDLSLEPGQRSSTKENSLIIGTGKGSVEILELQKPGGKMLPIADFLRGYAIHKEITFLSPSDQISLIRTEKESSFKKIS